MNIHEELAKIKLERPERFKERFRMILFSIKNNPSAYAKFDHDVDLGDTILTKIQDTVYLVPKEYLAVFHKHKKKMTVPIGFTLLASSQTGIRLCAFGITIVLYEKAML
ncbi:MAG: hypothetical protein AABX86_00795 [Nanoarchaeota archaeon]